MVAAAPEVLRSRFGHLALLALALCLIELVALFNALPHIHDAIWQDEAVTLMFSSAQGMLHPFVDYSSPNDHVLFSSMLAGWLKLFPGGVDIFRLRLLPLLLFLAAVPVTLIAAFRLGGKGCAAIAGMMFAASTVTANFATQLRGYGPSWLFFSLIFLSALNFFGPRSWPWRITYLVSCVAAVAILPTNFFLAIGIGAAFAMHKVLTRGLRAPGTLAGVVLLITGPVVGLLSYAAVWRDLLGYSATNWSTWTRLGLMQDWLHATSSDFIVLVPLAVGGALIGLHRLWVRRGQGETTDDDGFKLVLLLVAAFAASVLAMPRIPFPRTLVPFLPVWCALFAFLVSYGVRQAVLGDRRTLFLGGAGIASLALLLNLPMQSCKAPTRGGTYDYDLCYQFFHDQYYPDKVVAIWESLGNTEIPIVTDFEGFYAIRILNAEVAGLHIYEYRSYPPEAGPAPLIVVNNPGDLKRITRALGLDAGKFSKIADSGYFDIYARTR